MFPKKRRTEGGQSCPLDREEPEGGTKLSPKQKETGGGQNCPLSREEPEGDKIVP